MAFKLIIFKLQNLKILITLTIRGFFLLKKYEK